MRNKYHAILVAAVIGAVIPNARAQGVSVWGSGQESCGKWLAERNSSVNKTILQNWILGFVTGSNWYAKSQARPPDAHAVAAFVDQYCQLNPLHPMVLAAAALVSEVGGPIAKHDWKR